MAALLPILAVLIAGIGVAIQPPTNAALARASGSVWLAALVSFLVGTAALLVIWAADRTPMAALKGAPWWAWFGGFYGAAFVSALAFAAPRLGLATALTMAIASQLATAMVLDHYGLLGLKEQPLTQLRGRIDRLTIGPLARRHHGHPVAVWQSPGELKSRIGLTCPPNARYGRRKKMPRSAPSTQLASSAPNHP